VAKECPSHRIQSSPHESVIGTGTFCKQSSLGDSAFCVKFAAVHSRLSVAVAGEKVFGAKSSQMTKALTPEESARGILAVFKAKGARANEVLLLGTVDRIFLDRYDGRSADFTFGLRQAVDMGWVELTGQGRQLRLTQPGFDAMLAKRARVRSSGP
jgi:hypothetical protein